MAGSLSLGHQRNPVHRRRVSCILRRHGASAQVPAAFVGFAYLVAVFRGELAAGVRPAHCFDNVSGSRFATERRTDLSPPLRVAERGKAGAAGLRTLRAEKVVSLSLPRPFVEPWDAESPPPLPNGILPEHPTKRLPSSRPRGERRGLDRRRE
jgi:hypothetical protein